MTAPTGIKHGRSLNLGMVTGIFLLSIAGGWWLASERETGRMTNQQPTPKAAPEIRAPAADAVPIEQIESSDFFTRVHVALSLPNREKRARALAVVADDARRSRDQGGAFAPGEDARSPSEGDS